MSLNDKFGSGVHDFLSAEADLAKNPDLDGSRRAAAHLRTGSGHPS